MASTTGPDKVAVFEFLLDTSLLERHLAKPNPDPTAVELITLFMANATAPPMADIQVVTAGGPINGTSIPEDEPETKKCQALKILALQAACFLKWDLTLLEKKLPLPMQQTLLLELQKAVYGPEFVPPSPPPSEFSEMSSDMAFACSIYHRWIIRAVILANFPNRGPKGINVQIPGQADPTAVMPDTMDTVLKKIQDDAGNAALFLEKLLESEIELRMPRSGCLHYRNDELPLTCGRWDKGQLLDKDDVACQMWYELGCYYFWKEDYARAGKMILAVTTLYPQLKNPHLCQLDPTVLAGYATACRQLLKVADPLANPSLQEQLQVCISQNYQGVDDVLLQDNVRQEIPFLVRELLEMSMLKDMGSSPAYARVTIYNNVRRVMNSKVTLGDVAVPLKLLDDTAAAVIRQSLKGVVPRANQLQKNFLKTFVRLICYHSPKTATTLKKDGILDDIFQSEEELLLSCQISSSLVGQAEVIDKSFTNDISLQVGQYERKLLGARRLEDVQYAAGKLRALGSTRPLVSINNRWELPRHFSSSLKTLQPGIDKDIMYILLAKAAELRALKQYAEAKVLYQKVIERVGENVPHLAWELFHLTLLEIAADPILPTLESAHKLQVIQQCKTCIQSFHKDRDNAPKPELVTLAAAALFNLREYEMLASLEHKKMGCLEFSALLAAVCHDICQNKGSRSVSREFWEAVLQMFGTSNVQHKRTAFGRNKEMHRELAPTSPNRALLLQFIQKIQDALALGVIVSCLTKLYNIFKDDPNNDMYLEYLAIWPAVVSNISQYNLQAVMETLQLVLNHALSVYPTHSSWLKSVGDFHYGLNHHSAALKYYLSAAVVSSDYFSQNLPRALFDDPLFKRIIFCCTKLQCHTQAAVFCQFLEEPNYTAAFKALGERQCHDSCDIFYPCIWDTTLLEFLVSLHTRRGEIDRRKIDMQFMGKLEMNSNNNEEIQRETANLRKGRFLRAVARQYL